VKVLYSPRSRRDLSGIRDFIQTKSGNAEVADSFIVRMLDACEALHILPERYPPYPYATNWRMMPFESYLIFFKVRPDEVRIGHIRHASRKPFPG
jgi:plasmid stabilization system protein ParE